jgi:hypothetical protein
MNCSAEHEKLTADDALTADTARASCVLYSYRAGDEKLKEPEIVKIVLPVAQCSNRIETVRSIDCLSTAPVVDALN